MDPDRTVEMIEEALAAGDRDEAGFLLDDLVDWIDSGGFKPRAMRANRDYLHATSLRITR